MFIGRVNGTYLIILKIYSIIYIENMKGRIEYEREEID